MWFLVVIFMLVDVHGKVMLASAFLLISLILKEKPIISKLINLYVFVCEQKQVGMSIFGYHLSHC
jgi:hypothetical protein